MTIPDMITKVQNWSLYYRTEIIWCTIGLIVGAILF